MKKQLIIIAGLLMIAVLSGYLAAGIQAGSLLLAVMGVAIFVAAFLNSELSLYVLIFSMLLSPEFMAGATEGATLGRGVTLRLDDFLLLIIGTSWFLRAAIYKDLGLFLKTPLNKPIFFYLVACILSTGLGIMAGRTSATVGFFYVLKYFEYFLVYFMVVNHLENREQLKRLLFCLFLTCLIVSLYGILQIPGGGRVSAPFEGEIGEPNTFGGYLLFIGAVAAGIYQKVQNRTLKNVLMVLIFAILPSFLFTESRSSYLAVMPAAFVLVLASRRRPMILLILIGILGLSPLFLPSQVKERILYTFTQPEESGQLQIGNIRLDTSTSARLTSWKSALKDWPRHPFLGYGVTGYPFIDAQFPRVLVETGMLGFAAFCYLLYAIFRLSLQNLQVLTLPFHQGVIIGFLAGYIGLLFHAIGANTFIIVRIMEPFWLLAGIVAVLPAVETAPEEIPEALNAV